MVQRLSYAILLAALLTGCVTAKTVHLPDGRLGYNIHCNGAARDVGDCMDKAAEVCAGPYQIVTQTGEVVGSYSMGTANSITNASATGYGNAAYGTAHTTTTSSGATIHGIHRSLIVECGSPNASAASH